MSFQATMSGDIKTKAPITDEQLKELEQYLRDRALYGDAVIGDDDIDFSGCSHKYDELIYHELAKIIPIKEGDLSFVGEDDSQWKLVWNDVTGRWDELNGHIEFLERGMPDYSKLKEMFQNFTGYLAENTGDPNYVTRMLTESGCDAETQKKLGLDFPEV